VLAAVFHGPNNIAVEEVTVANKQAMLKVNACAVCGYDTRVFRNGHRKVSPPVILGHELCGEILQDVPARNGTIKASSRVALCPLIPCLNCHYCRSGDYNLCTNLREVGSTLDGGFAQYVTIPDQIIKIGGLVAVPDSLSDEEAALLEPLACCLNSFSQVDAAEGKGPVVIVGDGPVGLLHLQLFKKLAGSQVAVVGKIPARMQKAESMGADAMFEYCDADIDRTALDVMKFTGDAGASIVVISTSNSAAFGLATRVAAKNSKINVFAGMPSGQQHFLLDANWLHYNQISITGTFSSTPAMLQAAAGIAAEKAVDLSKIVTHQYSLAEIEKAMLATERYYGLRAVINRF
jgi:L-iditol 2-dehydrogenase